MAQSGINFNPEWPIRVNVNHILGDEENLERIPAKIRKVKNLPLLFETAVELGRRKSVIEPGLVVPQGYQGRVQYLLPVYLTNMQKPDLAMTLTVMDGYYLGNTCLTLEIQLCLALSQMAKTVASASPKQPQVENPKYAMRTWLLRLGFIGDEFATARDILTKNLEGDTAFRHGRAA